MDERMKAKDFIFKNNNDRDIDAEAEIYHALRKAEEADQEKDSSHRKFATYPLYAIALFSASNRWWWSLGFCIIVMLATLYILHRFKNRLRRQLWEQFTNLIYKQEKNVYLYKKYLRYEYNPSNLMLDRQTRIAVTKEPVENLAEAYDIINKIPRDSGYKTLDLSDELDKAMKYHIKK